MFGHPNASCFDDDNGFHPSRLGRLSPFNVGASVGTIVTGILSAVTSSNIEDGMTVVLSRLSFGSFDALVWFLSPFMRAFPISTVKFFGESSISVPSGITRSRASTALGNLADEALDTKCSAEPLEANGSSCDFWCMSTSCDHMPLECQGTRKI